MLFYALILIGIIVGGLITHYYEQEFFLGVILGLFISMVVFGLFGTCVIEAISPIDYEINRIEYIAAFKNTSDVEGTFFLDVAQSDLNQNTYICYRMKTEPS
jgi:uncharacterized membrane protein YfcA